MYTVVKDIQLSKNFKLSEFVCHDKSGKVLYNPELITKLQLLRDMVKKSVIVVSAYRTPEYNALVGGAPKSQHLVGNAADIKVSGMTPLQIALLAEKCGFTGIGIYMHDGNSFTHVDVRPNKSYWKDAEGHKIMSIKSLKEVA
jgi:uncharacterized protein YcbK (DUF882 family)